MDRALSKLAEPFEDIDIFTSLNEFGFDDTVFRGKRAPGNIIREIYLNS